MKNRLDNLGSANFRGRLNGTIMILLGCAVLAGLLGVPVRRLIAIEEEHASQVDASARLASLRNEQQLFDEAGGPVALQALAHGIVGDLPSELSRTDLHGVVALLSTVCELSLDSLSVGEFKVIDAKHLDDAVAKCDLDLQGTGRIEVLAELVSLLRRLGYPTVIQDFRLSRESAQSLTFKIQATLGLFQSVPIPQALPSDVPDQEIPQ